MLVLQFIVILSIVISVDSGIGCAEKKGNAVLILSYNLIINTEVRYA